MKKVLSQPFESKLPIISSSELSSSLLSSPPESFEESFFVLSNTSEESFLAVSTSVCLEDLTLGFCGFIGIMNSVSM